MSKLQVDTIYAKDALNAPNFPAGASVTGVVTATSFSGSGANLTGLTTSAVPGISTQLHSVLGTVNVSGIGTFKNDVEFHGAQGVSSVTWDKSANALEFVDNALLRIGTGDDLEIYHADSINYIKTSTTLPLYIQAPSAESMARFTPNGGV